MMDSSDSEKIIHGPCISDLDKTAGAIYLTNKRILVVSKDLIGYSLNDVSNIKLHSRMANIPKEFEVQGTNHTLEIGTTSGNTFFSTRI